jgi:hypothetical protein
MLSVFGTSPCIISLSKRALNSFLSKLFFCLLKIQLTVSVLHGKFSEVAFKNHEGMR